MTAISAEDRAHGAATQTMRAAAALALIVLMGALAACGGGKDGSRDSVESGRFADDFRRVTADYQAKTKAIQADGRTAAGQGEARVLAVYESMRAAAQEARKEYENLTAPKAVAPVLGQLVGLLEQQEDALGAVIAAARSGDGAGLTSSLQRLAGALTEWGSVRQDLERKLEPGD